MNLLTGVISLVSAFAFITYLYGLKQIYSAMYSPLLFTLPVILLAIASYLLYHFYIEEFKK